MKSSIGGSLALNRPLRGLKTLGGSSEIGGNFRAFGAFFFVVSPRVLGSELLAATIGGKRHPSAGGSLDKQWPLDL